MNPSLWVPLSSSLWEVKRQDGGGSMSFRVNTNVPAIKARQNLKNNQRDLDKALIQLASGKRITEASDDAAGLAISETLKGHKHGVKAASRNATDAKAYVQAAEGALNEQNNILLRMRELSIQSASDTVSDQEREFVDYEFQELHEELERLANVTSYRGHKLLIGEAQEFDIQVGPNKGEENVINIQVELNATQSGLGTTGLDITDQDNAVDSLESLDDAISQVSGYRAKLGAYQSRLEKTENHLSNEYASVTEAESRIADTDFAEAAANLATAQIKNEAAISVLAQANVRHGRAMRLIERF